MFLHKKQIVPYPLYHHLLDGLLDILDLLPLVAINQHDLRQELIHRNIFILMHFNHISGNSVNKKTHTQYVYIYKWNVLCLWCCCMAPCRLHLHLSSFFLFFNMQSADSGGSWSCEFRISRKINKYNFKPCLCVCIILYKNQPTLMHRFWVVDRTKLSEGNTYPTAS